MNGDLCDLKKEQEERAVEGSDQGRKWIIKGVGKVLDNLHHIDAILGVGCAISIS